MIPSGATDVDGDGAGVTGTVLGSTGGVYRVHLDGGLEVEAFLRGKLKREARTGDRVVAGDRVEVADIGEPEDDGGHIIEEVLARRNELVRGGPGGRRAKVVVANLDRIAVVLSASDPPFQERVADRFFVLSEVCDIPPFLVLNKIDLPDSEEVVRRARDLYEGLGYHVVATSATAEDGLDSLGGMLHHGISAMIGPSGVGKSSLLNALLPDLELLTAPVTRRGGRGRHTTVGARLLRYSADGWIADTPGFSEIGLWNVAPSELGNAFPEFDAPSEACRFRGCSHSHEPDCGVRSALERGEIDERRYESYLTLLEEVSG